MTKDLAFDTRRPRAFDAPMIELFFDLTSPWTWLAVHNLVPMA